MEKNLDQVVILLAAFNGESYIGEQIESIMRQTYSNILLFVSDDGSTDSTREIVRKYTHEYNNIQLLPVQKSGGARGNFQRLITYALQHTDSKYYMFADQDDIWHDNKVEIELETIKRVEAEADSRKPILLYANYYDFYGTDVEQKVKAYNEPRVNSFSRIVLQSWLMGCTMILNRSLLELCHSIPVEADNHDAWIAMIASLAGRIEYIEEPLMLHRIHANNVTQQLNTTSAVNRVARTVKRLKTRKRYREKMKRLFDSIQTTVEGTEYDQQILNEFGRLLDSRGIKVYTIMNKNQFWGVNKLQRILFFIQFAIE